MGLFLSFQFPRFEITKVSLLAATAGDGGIGLKNRFYMLTRFPSGTPKLLYSQVVKLILPPLCVVRTLAAEIRDETFRLKHSHIPHENIHAVRSECLVAFKSEVSHCLPSM